jgi:hypothetical protein
MADRSSQNKKDKTNAGRGGRSGRGGGNAATDEAAQLQRAEQLLAALMEAITRISLEMATLGGARAPPATAPNGYKILILLALCFMIIIGFPRVGPE